MQRHAGEGGGARTGRQEGFRIPPKPDEMLRGHPGRVIHGPTKFGQDEIDWTARTARIALRGRNPGLTSTEKEYVWERL